MVLTGTKILHGHSRGTYQLFQWTISQKIFSAKFKSNEKFVLLLLDDNLLNRRKICASHDSTAVMLCAKFCSNHFTIIWLITWKFHWIQNMIQNMLVRWVSGKDFMQCSGGWSEDYMVSFILCTSVEGGLEITDKCLSNVNNRTVWVGFCSWTSVN